MIETVVLPGQVIDTSKATDAIKIGPGLYQEMNRVIAMKAGVLCSRKNSKYWIEQTQKRYIPVVNDPVVGIIIAKHAEDYKVTQLFMIF